MSEPHIPYLARLAAEDPAAMAELSRKAATSPARQSRPRKVPGAPKHLTNREWAVRREAATQTASQIMTALDHEGALPENSIAREAMQAAIEMVSADLSSKDRLAVIRTLLEFNLARPAMVSNVNIMTAEDWLDGLAAAEARQ